MHLLLCTQEKCCKLTKVFAALNFRQCGVIINTNNKRKGNINFQSPALTEHLLFLQLFHFIHSDTDLKSCSLSVKQRAL